MPRRNGAATWASEIKPDTGPPTIHTGLVKACDCCRILERLGPRSWLAAWCGHSEKIAREHYWQITDADYEEVARGATTRWSQRAPLEAAQVHETARNPGKCRVSPADKVTPTGLEPVLPP